MATISTLIDLFSSGFRDKKYLFRIFVHIICFYYDAHFNGQYVAMKKARVQKNTTFDFEWIGLISALKMSV